MKKNSKLIFKKKYKPASEHKQLFKVQQQQNETVINAIHLDEKKNYEATVKKKTQKMIVKEIKCHFIISI